MECNCNSANDDNNIIQFVKGTTVNLTFEFNEDISSYTGALFTIRKNYETAPIINKPITGLTGNYINITLTPTETNNFTEFLNGKNDSKYIWGLDLLDSNINAQINVFPQTGTPAPLCIVYKHVVEDVV